MNSRSRFLPNWMGGGRGGSGSMHPNVNTNFQQRNQQQYMQRSSVPHQQQFQNQQTQQWMRRNQLSSYSAVDEVEKTVQSENGSSQDWKARLKIPPLDTRYRTEICLPEA